MKLPLNKPPLKKPPLSYQRARVKDLSAFPIRDNPRLEILDYRLTTAPGLKNSFIRRPRTHGHGAARLASGFVIALCLAHDGGEWWVEVETAPFDEAADRRAALEPTPRLLADIYRAVQSRHLAAQGRAYGRSEGRN